MAAGDTDTAWIALGSNIGHRGRNLARLREQLVAQGLVIDGASSEILTRAIGLVHQPDYHNQVLRVRNAVPIPPSEWLRLVRRAEEGAGRKETYHWGPRIADADIILLGTTGDIQAELPDLVVPHARLRERPFLARLLAELGMTRI